MPWILWECFKSLLCFRIVVNADISHTPWAFWGSSGRPVLEQFWDDFGRLYPTHPVVLDILMGMVTPGLLVPLCIHGDGGRHVRKTEIMVVQFQSCVGQGTRISTGQKLLGKRKRADGEPSAAPAAPSGGAQVNLLGHSFETRFLVGTMAKRYYSADMGPLLEFFKHVSTYFGDLYRTGVRYRGQCIKFIVLAVKGDLPFLSKIATLERNFMHIRKRKKKVTSKKLEGMCWLCSAGNGEVLFEDFSRTAPWIETSGLVNEDPWKNQPFILFDLVHDPLRQPNFFAIDLFHTLNLD